MYMYTRAVIRLHVMSCMCISTVRAAAGTKVLKRWRGEYSSVQEKWRFQRAFRSKSECVPGPFWVALKIFVCTVPPDTGIFPTEFKFIIPKSWRLVVFCTCRILLNWVNFFENFPIQDGKWRGKYWCSTCICMYIYMYVCMYVYILRSVESIKL